MYYWLTCLSEGIGKGAGGTLLPVLLMRSSEMNLSHPGTSNITCVRQSPVFGTATSLAILRHLKSVAYDFENYSPSRASMLEVA